MYSACSACGRSRETCDRAVTHSAAAVIGTPIAYQTNVLILNAGGYMFTASLRVGVPLGLQMCAVLSYLLPIFFAL